MTSINQKLQHRGSPADLDMVARKDLFDGEPKLTRLSIVQAEIVILEFLVAAAVAFLASGIYHATVTKTWQLTNRYLLAALSLATLITLVSLGFQHFSKVQTKPRH